jgi:hypothetical protein
MTEPTQYVLSLQAEAVKRDMVSGWTVYDHPKDYPNTFVARFFVCRHGDPEPLPTDNHIVSPTLEDIRTIMRSAGLVPIRRLDDDDPKIVEVWL